MYKALALVLAVFCVEVFAADALFVALGGYKSCNDGSPYKMSLYGTYRKMAAAIRSKHRNRTFHEIVGCLEGSAPPKGMGRYILSDSPNTVRSGNTDRIADEMRHILKKDPDMPVFIMGHSYGGFQSMYLASELGKMAHIEGLFTIDPISPRCGPLQVAFGSEECQRAPRELDNRFIKAETGQWLNFYQRQHSWINSSAIPEADANYKMEYYWAHTDIDNDSRVWGKIEESVLKKLAQ